MKKPNEQLRYHRKQKGWSQSKLAELIGADVNVVSRWERGIRSVSPYYQTKLVNLFGKNAEELGLFDPIPPEQPQEVIQASSPFIPSSLQAFAEHDVPLHSLPQAPSQDIIVGKSDLEGQDLNTLRRKALQGALSTACSVIVLSPYALLDFDDATRYRKVITEYSLLDTQVLNHLMIITQSYWTMSTHTSFNLFHGIAGHFQNLIQLLKRSQPKKVTRSLYSLISQTAQILGKMLADVNETSLAWPYYSLALEAAKKAEDVDLWAAGLGRMSLLLIDNKQPQEALFLLEEGQSMSLHNPLLHAWLAAIRGEAYAYLDKFDECNACLNIAEEITSDGNFKEDLYATGFDTARLSAYKGTCFTRLGKADLALAALHDALNLVDPSALRRQARLHVNVGTVLAQQGDVKGAYTAACKALTLVEQTNSLSVLERIHLLQSALTPWGDNGLVQDLNQQVGDTHQHITAMKTAIIF